MVNFLEKEMDYILQLGAWLSLSCRSLFAFENISCNLLPASVLIILKHVYFIHERSHSQTDFPLFSGQAVRRSTFLLINLSISDLEIIARKITMEPCKAAFFQSFLRAKPHFKVCLFFPLQSASSIFMPLSGNELTFISQRVRYGALGTLF